MANTFRYYIPGQGETVDDAKTFTTIWDEDAIDYVAESAAAQEYRTRAGGVANWPITLVLLDWDREELGRFRVGMEHVPEFSAHPVKEPAT